MIKLFPAGAIALSASMALSKEPAQVAAVDSKAPPTREAKAKFLKKCLRNITPTACNAPPEARLHKR